MSSQPVPPHERHRCAAKQPYRSAGEARAAALMRGIRLYTYECAVCGFWHLTRRAPDAPREGSGER